MGVLRLLLGQWPLEVLLGRVLGMQRDTVYFGCNRFFRGFGSGILLGNLRCWEML